MSENLRAAIARLESVISDLRTIDLTEAPTRGEVVELDAADVSGLWLGKVVEEDTYQVMLQLHQAGTALRGSIVVYYDDSEEPYLACQQAEGSVDGEVVIVRGTDVTFIPDDPEADYGLDVLEMRLVNDGREMTGRWTDVDDDADGRVVVRRAFG